MYGMTPGNKRCVRVLDIGFSRRLVEPGRENMFVMIVGLDALENAVGCILHNSLITQLINI